MYSEESVQLLPEVNSVTPYGSTQTVINMPTVASNSRILSPMDKLPVELLLEIFDRLDPASKIRLAQSCRRFYAIYQRYASVHNPVMAMFIKRMRLHNISDVQKRTVCIQNNLAKFFNNEENAQNQLIAKLENSVNNNAVRIFHFVRSVITNIQDQNLIEEYQATTKFEKKLFFVFYNNLHQLPRDLSQPSYNNSYIAENMASPTDTPSMIWKICYIMKCAHYAINPPLSDSMEYNNNGFCARLITFTLALTSVILFTLWRTNHINLAGGILGCVGLSLIVVYFILPLIFLFYLTCLEANTDLLLKMQHEKDIKFMSGHTANECITNFVSSVAARINQMQQTP